MQISTGFASWERYCTASSSGRQPNFAASNRGRHLRSAGRPSRWALAHILVDGCVNADNVIRQHCFSLRDELRFGVAQFMRDSINLRDSVNKYGFLCFV